MNIKDKLTQDIKNSMKSGDKIRLETVRSISAGITTFEKANPGKELNITKILRQLENQRKQSIEGFEKGGETDRSSMEREELKIILEYIYEFAPKQMNLEETTLAAKNIIAECGFEKSDISKIMGEFKKRFSETVDMKLANEAVKSIIS